MLVILVAILIIYSARVAAVRLLATEDINPPEPTDFALEVFGEPGGTMFEEAANPPLPLFEPETGNWTVEGDRIDDLAPMVWGLEVGPTGAAPL